MADLHFRRQWFEWIAAEASRFDAVCLAGDLLDMWIARDVSLRSQTKWVRDWASSFRGRLFACSGNHDWWSTDEIIDTDASAGWLRKLSRTEVTVDNRSAQLGDVIFYCHSYAQRGSLPDVTTSKWILLHHEPPAGCAAAVSGVTGTDLDSPNLRDQLRDMPHAPFLVLSGHVHHPKSWRGQSGRSWVLNPCYDHEAHSPNHIIIDTKLKTQGPVMARIRGVSAPVRVVIIAPLSYRLRRGSRLLYRQPAYLICTDPSLPLERILQEYLWRWDIEVNFRDEKSLLGVSEAQLRQPDAVRRHPAGAVAAYAYLLLAAHDAYGHDQRPPSVPLPRWRRHQPPRRPTTNHLISQLRIELWSHCLTPETLSHFRSQPLPDQNSDKLGSHLASALFYAHN